VNDYKKQNEKIQELECELLKLKSNPHPNYNINSSQSISQSKSRDYDDCVSVNSHMIQSSKKYKSNHKVPKIDLSRVEVEESDEEEDIDKMIEEAIEVELEQNPDIANQFDSMEDFKRYIFDK
jgi:hypothetical protein